MVINRLDAALVRAKSFPVIVILLFVALVSFTGCQHPRSGAKTAPLPVPAVSGPADEALIHQLAQVDSVAAKVSPLDATKAEITISGLLPDGATQVENIQQQKLADGFVITVTTVRPKNATATLALIPFDRTISVSLVDLPKGSCKIMVNGVATTFMIP